MLASAQNGAPPVPDLLRLRDGATADQLRAELKVISNRIAMTVHEDPKGTEFLLKHATESQFHLQNFHYALIAAVLAVLLVACANLANLQLARGIGRSRELALRAALGASRSDIITHLLVESALVSVGGLVLGCLLTYWGVHFLDSRVPPSIADYVLRRRSAGACSRWRLARA